MADKEQAGQGQAHKYYVIPAAIHNDYIQQTFVYNCRSIAEMSSGTNWTGGRGYKLSYLRDYLRYIYVDHRKRAKHGLKILEHTPEQHFAKRRALMTQDRSQQEPILNVLSSVAFKHAQKHILHREPLRGTVESEPTCANSTLPRALSRPNKPVAQPRLSGLAGKAIQNGEWNHESLILRATSYARPSRVP